MDREVPEFPRRRKEDKPTRRFNRGLYILPSLFTTANIAAGYYAILQVTHGSVAEPWHFDFAAKAIGFAVLFDGLDGRIARMTHTSSDFGRELDSLADVITFGVAPAMLAWMWGFRQLPQDLGEMHADSCGSRRDRSWGSPLAGRADHHMVDIFKLDLVGCSRRIPDGQHLAVL